MKTCTIVVLFLISLAALTQTAPDVAKNYPAAEALYLDLHEHPELSLHENETAAKVAARLKSIGYEVTTGVGGTGVVGVLKNGDGPVIMLRTELDALPVREETNLAYASKVTTKDDSGATVSVMHACGHDLHMAALTGTADWMAQHRQQWHGTLIVIGQPAEERVMGAEAMLKDGLFTRFPKPSYIIAVHDTEMLSAGVVGYTPGFALTSADSVNITIYGRGAHGSRPHMAIDPIVIGAKIVLGLQTIVSRETRPGDHAVITVGSFHAGTRNNIIPDDAKLQLTVRAYKPAVRDHLIEGIKRVTSAEAEAGGATKAPLIEVTESTPATYNDPELTKRVAGALTASLGAQNVKEFEPDFPSEDFAYYVNAGVKGTMLRVGATNPEKFAAAQKSGEILPGLHTARFAPDLQPALRTAMQAEIVALLELMGTK
jgi:hippurate hydrolase